jgi:hypothetical protein
MSEVLETQEFVGEFYESLTRNNKKIRQDRAISIAEDALLMFKRGVEDTEVRIKKMRAEQKGLLDLSPTSADSLVLASDFNGENFYKEYMRLSREIYKEEINLKLAKDAYNQLFGG